MISKLVLKLQVNHLNDSGFKNAIKSVAICFISYSLTFKYIIGKFIDTRTFETGKTRFSDCID